MTEKFVFNIEKLNSVIKKGDYYSKDLRSKKIFILRKKEIDEIRQCFEFDNEQQGSEIDEEEKEAGVLFVIALMKDIIENRKYEIIEAELNKEEIEGAIELGK